MKEKLKSVWKKFWVDDSGDNSKLHLSQADKRSLWYGCFIICSMTVCFSALITAVSNARIIRQNEVALEQTVKIVAAYIALATDDEYREIMEKVRQDVSLNEIGEGLEDYIKYIPNTADWCCAEPEYLSGRTYLVSINTGYLYSLDLSEDADAQGQKSNGMRMTIGSDETSRSDIQVIKYSDRQEGYAEINRGNDAVSFLKMKTIFCDECIRKIWKAIEGQPVQEVVLYDAEEKVFYPVEDGRTEIGDCILDITFEEDDINIRIS